MIQFNIGDEVNLPFGEKGVITDIDNTTVWGYPAYNVRITETNGIFNNVGCIDEFKHEQLSLPIKEIDGDLIKLAEEGNFDAIVHGCNCFNTMGAGIAKQLRAKYPQIYETDCTTVKGDFNKLGNYTVTKIEKNLIDAVNTPFDIINAYTQYEYGTDKMNVDYDAITMVMKKINHAYNGKRIGLPKIGAGLAGGDWNIIRDIIEEQLKNCEVTIVNFNQNGLW